MALPAATTHLTRQLTGFSDALGDQGPCISSPSWAHGGLSRPTVRSSSASSVFDAAAPPYFIRSFGVTDEGVKGKQNQDDFFLWESDDQRVVIAAVFDGHGRELGQVAAKVAKAVLREELAHPEVLAAVRRNPAPALTAAFAKAHRAIERTFAAHYEAQGWVVERSPEGYLTRSRPRGAAGGSGAGGGVMCVHGGTTATVAIVLDGRRVVTANVGDSTALLVGLGGGLTRPRPASEWTPMPDAGGLSADAAAFLASGGGGATPSGLSPMVAGMEISGGGGSSAGAGGGDVGMNTGAGSGGGKAALHLPHDDTPGAFHLGSPLLLGLSTSTGSTASTLSVATAALASSAGSAYSVASVSSAASSMSFLPASPALRPLGDLPLAPVPPQASVAYAEVSADHSPECPDEFRRMHAFRPHRVAAHTPELLFVYDTLSPSKLGCPAIFGVDPATGHPAKTERGSYYKNVRCEWATLVATPPHAPFQDALAFTRSLGDFHLQTYGVSHTPEVWWADLAAPADGGGHQPLVAHPFALVLASDGIWDNWKFEEVASFVLAPQLIADVVMTNSAAGAAAELMAANLARAHANFGDSADNMTALVAYFLPRLGGGGSSSGGGGAVGGLSSVRSSGSPLVSSASEYL